MTIFVGLPVWFFSAISSQGEPQAKDLDLSIKTAGSDIQIRNNEPGELRNCTVEINGGYTARISSIGGEYGTYELSSFTKGDGERFNNLTHSVNSVVVDRCLNEDGRVGVYGN